MAINIGIIGCGGITAFNHLPQLISSKKNMNIKYLCDININRAKLLKNKYELDYSTCIEDYQKVLEDDDINAVIVAAWPTNNLIISIDALKKHKHVLLQKPIIDSNDLKEEFVNLACNSDLNVMPLPYVELLEPFEKLKEIINSDTLGIINFARIRTSITNPADYYNDVKSFFSENSKHSPYEIIDYANERGCLSDMGPYALSTFYYLFGEGKLLNSYIYPQKFDQVALLSLRTSNTISLCSVEIGWNQIRGSELCSIYGSDGTVYMQSNGDITINYKKGRIDPIPFILNNCPVLK